MKNIIFILISMAYAIFMQAQAGVEGFNYQAVLKDNQNQAIKNQQISVTFKVLPSVNGNPVFTETQQAVTDESGLFNLVIGENNPAFQNINWAGGEKYLEVTVNINGNDIPMGLTRFQAVPYAKYAMSSPPGSPAGQAGGDLNGNYPNPGVKALQGKPLSLQNPTAGQVLKWDGSQWKPDQDNGQNVTAGPGIQILGSQIINTGDITASDDITHQTVSGGDVSGTFFNLKVEKIQNHPVLPIIPQHEQVLKWDGNQNTWKPGNDNSKSYSAGNGIQIQNDQIINTGDVNPNDDVTNLSQAGGDIQGTFQNLKVVRIQNQNVSATLPQQGQVLKYDAGQNTWKPDMDNNQVYTAGTGIQINGNEIQNTGDSNPGDDITVVSQAGGDISGTFQNMEINPGSVGSPEIQDGSVQAEDLAPGVIGNELWIQNGNDIQNINNGKLLVSGEGEVIINGNGGGGTINFSTGNNGNQTDEWHIHGDPVSRNIIFEWNRINNVGVLQTNPFTIGQNSIRINTSSSNSHSLSISKKNNTAHIFLEEDSGGLTLNNKFNINSISNNTDWSFNIDRLTNNGLSPKSFFSFNNPADGSSNGTATFYTNSLKLDGIPGGHIEGIVSQNSTNFWLSGKESHIYFEEYPGAQQAYIRNDPAAKVLSIQNNVTGGRVTLKAPNIAMDGNVGIGVGIPTRGRLEITKNTGLNYFLNQKYTAIIKPLANFNNIGNIVPLGATYVENSGGAVNYSIYAESRIACDELNVFSDGRIKKIHGKSNAIEDLRKLRQIEIIDYSYIDNIKNGNLMVKKVIGQQVAQVFPQAVKTNNVEFIPNIFKERFLVNQWINLDSVSNLSVGDKLKIIFESGEEEVVSILEIKNKVDYKLSTNKIGKVFIYGKEVNDFHIVDYDAIAMLNVSATQELAQQIESLLSRVKTLEKEKEEANKLHQHMTEKIYHLESSLLSILEKLSATENAKDIVDK